MRIAAAILIILALPAFGQTITHDMGGPVEERVAIMRHMHGVRIEGDCFSACTMFLGLPGTCVTPSARLGFHSPSTRIGLPLPRDEWEEVTRMMASYYPTAIRQWFLQDARFSEEIVMISGVEAVRLGARQC